MDVHIPPVHPVPKVQSKCSAACQAAAKRSEYRTAWQVSNEQRGTPPKTKQAVVRAGQMIVLPKQLYVSPSKQFERVILEVYLYLSHAVMDVENVFGLKHG